MGICLEQIVFVLISIGLYFRIIFKTTNLLLKKKTVKKYFFEAS